MKQSSVTSEQAQLPCPICNRVLGSINVDEHHLIPRTFGGEEKILIHRACHTKLHSVFTEREMQHFYNTVDRLVEHSEIQKWIKWISKRPSDFYDKNEETNSRRGKRRR